MFTRKTSLLALPIAAILLHGCGGGGSGPSPIKTRPTTTGGTTTTGTTTAGTTAGPTTAGTTTGTTAGTTAGTTTGTTTAGTTTGTTTAGTTAGTTTAGSTTGGTTTAGSTTGNTTTAGSTTGGTTTAGSTTGNTTTAGSTTGNTTTAGTTTAGTTTAGTTTAGTTTAGGTTGSTTGGQTGGNNVGVITNAVDNPTSPNDPPFDATNFVPTQRLTRRGNDQFNLVQTKRNPPGTPDSQRIFSVGTNGAVGNGGAAFEAGRSYRLNDANGNGDVFILHSQQVEDASSPTGAASRIFFTTGGTLIVDSVTYDGSQLTSIRFRIVNATFAEASVLGTIPNPSTFTFNYSGDAAFDEANSN